jgi:hypothetical protein
MIKRKLGSSEQKFVINKIKEINGANKNVLSVSYFTFKTAYKPVSFYGEGLLFLSEVLSTYENKHNLILRVYYDDSIEKYADPRGKEILELLKANPLVEIFHVDTSRIIDIENSMILCMIFRYLPMFDFIDNDVKFCYVLDVDLTETKKDVSKIKYSYDEFVQVIENNIDIKYKAPMCYTPFWSARLFGNRTQNTVLGNSIGGKFKLPRSIFINFINSFVDNSDPVVNQFLENYKNYVNTTIANRNDDNTKKKKNTCINGQCIFVYGFDEFFLNVYFISWCYKNANKICIHMTHPQGATYILLATTFIESGNKPKLTALVEEFSEKYNFPEVSGLSFDRFLAVFGKHDYEGKNMRLHDLYNSFHKFITSKYQYLASNKLIDSGKFVCYRLNDTYLYDKNNFKCLTADEKENMYNQIDRLIRTLKNNVRKGGSKSRSKSKNRSKSKSKSKTNK